MLAVGAASRGCGPRSERPAVVATDGARRSSKLVTAAGAVEAEEGVGCASADGGVAGEVAADAGMAEVGVGPVVDPAPRAASRAARRESGAPPVAGDGSWLGVPPDEKVGFEGPVAPVPPPGGRSDAPGGFEVAAVGPVVAAAPGRVSGPVETMIEEGAAGDACGNDGPPDTSIRGSRDAGRGR